MTLSHEWSADLIFRNEIQSGIERYTITLSKAELTVTASQRVALGL
jgi:hypothetical protein